MPRIESANNPLLKTVRRLARARRREPTFLIEGRKLVEEALAQGSDVEMVLVSADGPTTSFPEATEVKASLLDRVSSLKSPDGVVAIAKRPSFAFSDFPGESLVVVSAGIQDPGNLGAIVRVAEAAGAEGLVVLPGSADPFGPKAVRGSMGSVLRLPVVELESVVPLRERGFQLVALQPRGGTCYREYVFRRPTAIVLGREGSGLRGVGLTPADGRISIPMLGNVDSLNVATAAALVLYEATRPERR